MKNKLKFSLFVDGNPVRSIDALKENFNANDIWEYYNNNMLQKWLDSRGANEYLTEIKKIEDKTPYNVLKELCNIFDIEETESLDAAIKSFVEKEESKKRNSENIKYKNVSADDYDNLVNTLTNEYSKLSQYNIKDNVKILSNNYADFIRYDSKRLFDLLWSKAPVALLYVIGEPKLYRLIKENIDAKRTSKSEVKSWVEALKMDDKCKDSVITRAHLEKNIEDKVETDNVCIVLTEDKNIIIDAKGLDRKNLQCPSTELYLLPALNIKMTFKSKTSFYCFELR